MKRTFFTLIISSLTFLCFSQQRKQTEQVNNPVHATQKKEKTEKVKFTPPVKTKSAYNKKKVKGKVIFTPPLITKDPVKQ